MDGMKAPEPTKEHQWLQQMVGEWTMAGKADAGPEKAEHCDSTGRESVSSLGGLWVVCEGEGTMPDGTLASMRMVLGFDPSKEKFVGTWFGSMMTNLWIYEGELDESGRVLTLHTEGPGFEEGAIGQYKDVIEFKSEDHRVLTSHARHADGSWQQFMQADYHRAP